MKGSLTTLRFADTEVRIYDAEGDRWITMKDLGAALGYADPKSVGELIRVMRDRGELHKGTHLNWVPLATSGGFQETMVLSKRGIIRVAMRSDAPRAAQFRDWAETVLYEVMTTGSYSLADSGWIGELAAPERLRLQELRVRVELAKDPTSSILQKLMAETYGRVTDMSEYLGLVAAVKPQQARKGDRRRVKPPIGRLDKDPEVKAFVENQLKDETMTYRAIHVLAAEKFGAHRVPKVNGLWRHHRRMRDREEAAAGKRPTVVRGQFS